uniref:Uncharacterized protein n=1 Tax=Nelumbo nucifera TaxID=4432 RepID=A0A822YTW9_NELNU|nr:TPA_asm: hypothetical protein HUJ06_005489 [Nelumbo nucifera]
MPGYDYVERFLFDLACDGSLIIELLDLKHNIEQLKCFLASSRFAAEQDDEGSMVDLPRPN